MNIEVKIAVIGLGLSLIHILPLCPGVAKVVALSLPVWDMTW